MDNKRDARKEAASYAAEIFAKMQGAHFKSYGHQPTAHEQAEMAIDAKQEAEKQFDAKISVTFDVEDNCFFQ